MRSKEKEKGSLQHSLIMGSRNVSVARKLMGGRTLTIEEQEKTLAQTWRLLSKANRKLKGKNSEQTS